MTTDRIWREGATPEEEWRIAAIDGQLADLRDRSAELCRERQLIANRACQRARYARKKITRDAKEND